MSAVSDLLGTVNSGFGQRFNLIGILPSFVFTIFTFSLILLWQETPSPIPNLKLLINKINTMDITDGVFIIIIIIVFSVVLHPLQLTLVRLFEGYWGDDFVSKILSKIGIAFQKYQKTHKKHGPIYLLKHYPRDKRFLPTSLGNILRATEDIAGQRYNLSTVTIWPRLYPLISENLRNILNDQRNQLDVSLRFCSIFLISTITSFGYFIYLIYHASLTDFQFNFLLYNDFVNISNFYIWIGLITKYIIWLTIPIFTFVLAWLSYRGAISAALSYGESIKTAFDLHRFDLLKSLHLPLPANSDIESYDNGKLSDFLVLNHKQRFTYSHQTSE